jgi:hypothetical protein
MGTCGMIWNASNEDKTIQKHSLSILKICFRGDFINMTYKKSFFEHIFT